jgi:arylsulfatase A-like enzyme
MNQTRLFPFAILLLAPLAALQAAPPAAPPRPNILILLADDLGYGDVGCYGATKIQTPHMDRLAQEGVRFSDAHSVAAVCNPSRYSILSGTYLWHAKRKNDYSLYFHDGQVTLPGLLKSAGYRTAALGKWHNGFGRHGDPDWNGELKPGPLEIGYLPKQGSCGMTVQVPPGAPWGQPYARLGLSNSDVDAHGKIKPEAPPVQLYNLATDPGQTTNAAAAEPQRAAAMQKRLVELTARPKPR